MVFTVFRLQFPVFITRGRLTVAGAILCRSVSQDALRSGSHPRIAGCRSGESGGKAVREAQRGVRVQLGLGLRLELRPVRLVVQAAGDTQVAAVLVHAAHVQPASIRQGATLVHIWGERESERDAYLRRSDLRKVLVSREQCHSPTHCLALRSYVKPSGHV